jgi:hypothetical protein
MLSGIYSHGGCSSSTPGVFSGGQGPINVIQYVTIATTGNAIDFGDLTVARYGTTSTSSSTLVFTVAGTDGFAITNVIDYVTIASTGNAVDFGDLMYNSNEGSACSNAHGGL